jgi:hypothetical protein
LSVRLREGPSAARVAAFCLFFDHLCLEIRSKTRSKVKRAEIIRALVAGLMGSGMDLTAFRTEEDIAAAIQERLKR